MARAEEQLERYQQEIVTLRRHDSVAPEEAAGVYAATWASFSCGYLMGAGLPAAAATIAHLFRKAYPGAPFPILWSGEA